MKNFFSAIADLFVNVLLAPLDFLRDFELENWWGANFMSWIFILVAFSAFVYWMLQLKGFADNNEDDKSITSHPYL